MKAILLEEKLKAVDDAPVPFRDGEALVQVICAGICNTDLEIVKGYAGFRGILGHEFVGRVVESPDGSLVGRRVVGEINVGCGVCRLCRDGDSRHCAARTVLGIKGRDGAFAEFVSLPVRNLVEVPDSFEDEAAVFVEPLAAALNILDQTRIDSASDVVVVGDGKLAQLIVVALSETGCNTTVMGKHPEKLKLAREFGASRVLKRPDAPDPDLYRQFNIVIEASGSPSGLASALELVKPRGTIILKSTHHEVTPLDATQIVVNEVTVMGSRCGRLRSAIEFLARRDVDLSVLISRRRRLEDGLRAFEEASAPGSMKVILQVA